MTGVGGRLARFASWRVLLVMALTLGVLGMQSGRGTLAYFTDSVSSPGNLFTAGNLKLLLNGTNVAGIGTAITFNTVTTKLKPGDVRYGYWTIENDDSSGDGVPAFFNGTSNGTITFARTESLAAPSDATKASNLDTRINVAVKDFTGVGAVTDSTTCATNWATLGTALTVNGSLGGASSAANRAALSSGTAVPFVTDAITINPGAANAKKYCMQFTWVDGTSGAALTNDNGAKQGANTYTITFNGASS